MLNIYGKVVEVEKNATIKKKNGGTYSGTRLMYRDDSGELKEKAFHENSLKYNKEVSTTLYGLSSGDEFTMAMEKEGDFWNVKNITKGRVNEETPAAAASQTTSKAAPARTGNTYPTAEERAKTQVYIIRQSCISSAVNSAIALKLKTPQEVISTARMFENYVNGLDDMSTLESDNLDDEVDIE